MFGRRRFIQAATAALAATSEKERWGAIIRRANIKLE